MPNAVLAEFGALHADEQIRIVDPLAADFTVILTTDAADRSPGPVFFMPDFEHEGEGLWVSMGIEVYSVDAGDHELSDTKLETVAGGGITPGYGNVGAKYPEMVITSGPIQPWNLSS